MEPAQPANGTVNTAPSSTVNTGGQSNLTSTRRASPSSFQRDWWWKPDIGDVTLVLRALAVSYGLIFGLIMFFVPGAVLLAAAAFWHPDLILTWQVSTAIAFGASVLLLLVLMILTGLIGGRATPFFMVLAVAALVLVGVAHHREPALVDALWNHLTR